MSYRERFCKPVNWVTYAALVVLSLLALALWPSQLTPLQLAHTSGLSFSVSFGDPVAMSITRSARYGMEGDESAREWAGLVPRGGHTVHIARPGDAAPTAHTVTLFHQMKCLDLIRQDMLRITGEGAPPSAMTTHCLNYLRQTIMCRPNLRLEPVKNVRGGAVRTYDAACYDWTRVYEEAERNHAAYAVWRNASSSAVQCT